MRVGMLLRLRQILPTLLAVIMIAGCAANNSPSANEPDPTHEPSQVVPRDQDEDEPAPDAYPSPSGNGVLIEEDPAPEPFPVDAPVETPPVLELAPTPIIKNSPVIQEGTVTDPFSPTIPAPEDSNVQSWINQAKEDLAQRLDIQVEHIDLISFELKVWSDAGLGCPQPGMNYIQVPQDGYLIVLRANSQLYNYHGGGSGDPSPFLCAQYPSDDKFLPPPGIDE